MTEDTQEEWKVYHHMTHTALWVGSFPKRFTKYLYESHTHLRKQGWKKPYGPTKPANNFRLWAGHLSVQEKILAGHKV